MSPTNLEDIFDTSVSLLERGLAPDKVIGNLDGEASVLKPLLSTVAVVRRLPEQRLPDAQYYALTQNLQNLLQNLAVPAAVQATAVQPAYVPAKNWFWTIFTKAQAVAIALAFTIIISTTVFAAALGTALQSPRFELEGQVTALNATSLVVNGESIEYGMFTQISGGSLLLDKNIKVLGATSEKGTKVAFIITIKIDISPTVVPGPTPVPTSNPTSTPVPVTTTSPPVTTTGSITTPIIPTTTAEAVSTPVPTTAQAPVTTVVQPEDKDKDNGKDNGNGKGKGNEKTKDSPLDHDNGKGNDNKTPPPDKGKGKK